MDATITAERTRPYEGMFLFPQSATADLQGSIDHVKEILARSGAEVLSIAKWDERRLAYDIKGNKRGLYILAFFRVLSSKLTGIERDCNLSEKLLRSMVTRADHLTEEQLRNAEAMQRTADEARLRGAGDEPEAPAEQG
ncbi:MAG: 30S ribosomal protein S6 [Planctomycetes bacterium]|nr:30S ribosomal protein S6 [Planctomycetota bacterium]